LLEYYWRLCFEAKSNSLRVSIVIQCVVFADSMTDYFESSCHSWTRLLQPNLGLNIKILLQNSSSSILFVPHWSIQLSWVTSLVVNYFWATSFTCFADEITESNRRNLIIISKFLNDTALNSAVKQRDPKIAVFITQTNPMLRDFVRSLMVGAM
jgi:hypothetical protein